MADITDPEAVRFCNEKVRTAADRLAQTYYFAKIVQQEWNANNMSSTITNTSDAVVDGAAQDGRHPITGIGATAIVTRCGELVTDMEANTNAKLNTVLGAAVNPERGVT